MADPATAPKLEIYLIRAYKQLGGQGDTISSGAFNRVCKKAKLAPATFVKVEGVTLEHCEFAEVPGGKTKMWVNARKVLHQVNALKSELQASLPIEVHTHTAATVNRLCVFNREGLTLYNNKGEIQFRMPDPRVLGLHIHGTWVILNRHLYLDDKIVIWLHTFTTLAMIPLDRVTTNMPVAEIPELVTQEDNQKIMDFCVSGRELYMLRAGGAITHAVIPTSELDKAPGGISTLTLSGKTSPAINPDEKITFTAIGCHKSHLVVGWMNVGEQQGVGFALLSRSRLTVLSQVTAYDKPTTELGAVQGLPVNHMRFVQRQGCNFLIATCLVGQVYLLAIRNKEIRLVHNLNLGYWTNQALCATKGGR